MRSVLVCFIVMATMTLQGFCSADTLLCTSLADALSNGHVGGANEARVNALEEKVDELQKLLQDEHLPSVKTIQGMPRDCLEIYESGVRTDGQYAISPDGRCPFFVYCDMTDGGWTHIQNRVDGAVSFYRPWVDYVQGFGDLDANHWLGLDKIHRLTADGTQIYFNMTMWDGTQEYAHYQVFTVHGANTEYTMNVDAFGYDGSINELLSYHNNRKFSTFDRDNDANAVNCCEVYLDGGGWWYNSCYRFANVNGVYGKQLQGGIDYWDAKNIPIKTVTVKVKRRPGLC